MHNVTFIIHLRKDSEERKKNADIIIQYYRKVVTGCKFIVVEDDIIKNFEYLAKDNDVNYIFMYNEGQHNKCKGYNLGLHNSTSDIVCFLDIDCIVSEENIIKAIDNVYRNNGLTIGYNGVCVYFDYPVKSQIKSVDGLYDFLASFVDMSKLVTGYKTGNYHIANTHAVGGVLFGKRQTFIDIGGFNPNFKGWGYEDNEIIIRAKKLDIQSYYINTNKPYLLHIPHIEEEFKNKESMHVSYKLNEQEFLQISSLTKSKLMEYIKTWK
jgi:predicted glycosyltransferase involved in capsule biosynthesis